MPSSMPALSHDKASEHTLAPRHTGNNWAATDHNRCSITPTEPTNHTKIFHLRGVFCPYACLAVSTDGIHGDHTWVILAVPPCANLKLPRHARKDLPFSPKLLCCPDLYTSKFISGKPADLPSNHSAAYHSASRSSATSEKVMDQPGAFTFVISRAKTLNEPDGKRYLK